ncbi:hypothetical protein [Ferruginibacter albus]|uniref:hypothetical protein n=1 Tax=Ferruginibacter albus TaxID=2875540 RepID=UPI001CC4874E|nr:hypothetical protein [Ferruginibacter albus]UAY53042.1 hypothetical protein K9M53_05020 [Ferruginibacter albus]
MKKYHQALIVIYILFSSCAIKPSSYIFPTKEKMVFSWKFKFEETDEMKSGIYNSFFQSYRLNNVSIYYVVDEEDLARGNSAFASADYFLNSAMIFRNDSVLLAPFGDLGDIKQLQPGDFKFVIPKHVNSSDTIKIVHEEKTILLFGFNKTKLKLNKVSLKNCLNIKVQEKWEGGNCYQGEVWLHKKYGLVKWMRVTGRVEERKL